MALDSMAASYHTHDEYVLTGESERPSISVSYDGSSSTDDADSKSIDFTEAQSAKFDVDINNIVQGVESNSKTSKKSAMNSDRSAR